MMLQPFIGLEVHVSLATKTKLFSPCPLGVGEPNTFTDAVSLGLPGSKPVLNAAAVDAAAKIALALNCFINKQFYFSRKTYFYPDLAKNYQISQYETPIGVNGYVLLSSGKKVRIQRVHLEEDPASLVHADGMRSSSHCLVDYNRSGAPLVEIVTSPDLGSPQEARDFLDKLLLLLSYLRVFDEKTGAVKADCNISLSSTTALGTRVEVKNVNGIRAAEKALQYEIVRQTQLLSAGKKVVLETRSFDEKTSITHALREKESEEDYGYIFDADLPVVELSEEMLSGLKKSLPELPDEKRKRIEASTGIDQYTSRVIVSNFALANLFTELAEQQGIDAKTVAAFLTRELLAVLNHSETSIEKAGVQATDLAPLLVMLWEKKITEKNAKEAVIAYVGKKIKPAEFIARNNLGKDMGEDEGKQIVSHVLHENQQAVQDYRAGEKRALNFLLGKIMRESRGKLDPQAAQKLLEEKLAKNSASGP